MEKNSVFLDSSFLVGIVNKDDALHIQASALWGKIRASGEFFPVTSNFVVSEVITVLSQRASKKLAMSFVDFVYGSFPFHVITVERSLEEKAGEYFKRMPSKNVSFCDCTTFAIAEVYGIPYVATFDKDFKKKGLPFEVLS